METKHLIMANLPVSGTIRKRGSPLFLIVQAIHFFFGMVWLVVHDYRKELPLMASGGLLLVVIIVVSYESIVRYCDYRRKMETIVTS